jgi:hypothetical protein
MWMHGHCSPHLHIDDGMPVYLFVSGLQGPVLGVIDVIVAAMERHRSVIRVAEYGLWCTENVSYIKEHKVHTDLSCD